MRPHLVEAWLMRPGHIDLGSVAFEIALSSERIVGYGKLHLAQALHLVSEPRRLLEFQVCRRRAHALLHVGDDAFEVMPDQRLVLLAEPCAGIDQYVVALVDGCENVAD